MYTDWRHPPPPHHHHLPLVYLMKNTNKLHTPRVDWAILLVRCAECRRKTKFIHMQRYRLRLWIRDGKKLFHVQGKL